jgi:hypothetical protein
MKDKFLVTPEACQSNGLRYDPDLAEASGLTEDEITTELLKVFVAEGKTLNDYTNSEISSIIKLIMINRYVLFGKKKAN